MGPIHPVWALAAIHPGWGNRYIAAGALATYLIPGCVERGVRLGSESLFGGGVWKSGNHDSQQVLPRGPTKRGP